MAKFRIDAGGIKMAKPGKNVDSAPLNDLVFSSDFPSLRVKYTDIVTAVRYDSAPDNEYSNVYNRARVEYPVPFSNPPVVLVAGLISSTESDQKSVSFTDFYSPGAYSFRVPWYTVNSLVDRFDLYVLARLGTGSAIPNRTLTYRYYVFDSLIEAT